MRLYVPGISLPDNPLMYFLEAEQVVQAPPVSSSFAGLDSEPFTVNTVTIICFILLITSGLIIVLNGIRRGSTLSTVTGFYLGALLTTCIVLSVGCPQGSPALRAFGVILPLVSGLISAQIARIWLGDWNQLLVGLVGGFSFAMWCLTLRSNGLIQNNIAKITFTASCMAVGCLGCYLTFTQRTCLCIHVAFIGSTSILLATDCLLRAGLKEFWIYNLELKSAFYFPTHTFYVDKRLALVHTMVAIVAVLAILSTLVVHIFLPGTDSVLQMPFIAKRLAQIRYPFIRSWRFCSLCMRSLGFTSALSSRRRAQSFRVIKVRDENGNAPQVRPVMFPRSPLLPAAVFHGRTGRLTRSNNKTGLELIGALTSTNDSASDFSDERIRRWVESTSSLFDRSKPDWNGQIERTSEAMAREKSRSRLRKIEALPSLDEVKSDARSSFQPNRTTSEAGVAAKLASLSRSSATFVGFENRDSRARSSSVDSFLSNASSISVATNCNNDLEMSTRTSNPCDAATGNQLSNAITFGSFEIGRQQPKHVGTVLEDRTPRALSVRERPLDEQSTDAEIPYSTPSRVSTSASSIYERLRKPTYLNSPALGSLQNNRCRPSNSVHYARLARQSELDKLELSFVSRRSESAGSCSRQQLGMDCLNQKILSTRSPSVIIKTESDASGIGLGVATRTGPRRQSRRKYVRPPRNLSLDSDISNQSSKFPDRSRLYKALAQSQL